MRELDKRIATLRFRLAEIRAREDQAKLQQRQFKNQQERITDFAIYENGDLEATLSMAEEVDSRLAQVERTLRYLAAIRTKGQEELDALLLTRSIEEAKAALTTLQAKHRQLGEELAQLDRAAETGSIQVERREELQAQRTEAEAGMKRLRESIGEASEAAARAVAAHLSSTKPDERTRQ